MLWIVLAAQFSLPIPVGSRFPDVRAIFSADDVPAYVVSAGITRFVPTRTTVGPDGTARDCAVERSSGDVKLDALTCSIILQRAKFETAKWLDGSSAYGVLRVPIIWAIGGSPSKRQVERAYPADLEVSVSRLPAGTKGRPSLSRMVAVDDRGRVVSCRDRPPVSNPDRAKTFPELVSIACQQLTTHFTAVPVKDAGGKPIHSVQNATVVLTTGR